MTENMKKYIKPCVKKLGMRTALPLLNASNLYDTTADGDESLSRGSDGDFDYDD